MKTEQIDVPHFEGFECVGVCVPSGIHHYILNSNGKNLILSSDANKEYKDIAQLCYKKIPPRTMTLMYIPKGIAQEGDYTESVGGDLYKINNIGIQYNKLWRPI